MSTLGGGVEDKWDEMGLEGLMERQKGREVPPGMAVSLERSESRTSPLVFILRNPDCRKAGATADRW